MIPNGWNRRCLGDDITLISGQHLLSEEYDDSPSGIPYLTGPSDYSVGIIMATKFTKSPKSMCKKGDILITVKGSGTGTTIIADQAYCISRQLMAIRPKTWDPYFLWSVVTLHEAKYENTSVGLIPGISRDDVLETPIWVPDITEQFEIGKRLSIWDRSIDLASRLFTAKQERRTWLMQQLLMGKRRAPGFSKKWVTKCMKDLVEPIQRPFPKPKEPYKALGIRSHCKGTFERRVSDPTTVDMDELFIVQKGDLIVNITFAWEGAIAFVPEEHDGNLVSHRFPTYTLKENEVDADFLRHMVIRPRFIFTLGLLSPGGAGRNRVMSKRDFLDIELSVPCLEEQRKIGKILKLADKEMILLSKLLNTLREQKKGLLQQLLTGKRRVKLDN